MYLTTDSLDPAPNLLPIGSSTVTTLKMPVRQLVMNIAESHLLLQFSMNNEIADYFDPPPELTTCLILDPLASRRQRKSREGRDSHTLLVKQGPTGVHVTIPDGFYLSNPWHQRREKMKDGRKEVYTMFRMSINRDDGREGTHPEALAFLQRLLQFRWATRGYVNNLQHETQFFYSLNFEDIELSSPLQLQTIEHETHSRNLYLMPSAEVIATSMTVRNL